MSAGDLQAGSNAADARGGREAACGRQGAGKRPRGTQVGAHLIIIINITTIITTVIIIIIIFIITIIITITVIFIVVGIVVIVVVAINPRSSNCPVYQKLGTPSSSNHDLGRLW